MTTSPLCPSAAARPVLSPQTIAVRRGDHELQFGLADDVAVTVPLPVDVSAGQMLEVLQALDGTAAPADALRACALDGAAGAAAGDVIAELSAAGILTPAVPDEPGGAAADSSFGVHILGSGDLALRVHGPLQQQGFVVSRSPRPTLDLDMFQPPWRRNRAADVVVLADDLVPDPLVVTALHRSRTPHVYMACRDGRVVVGPTVLPGRSTCLRCADLYRADRNPRWPVISAQLLWTSGFAPLPSRVAGVALLVSELGVLRAAGAAPDAAALPLTVAHSVELSVAQGMWRRRHWPPHPRCGCGAR